MAEKTFTIDDMIASVLDRQPETFKDAFNDLIGQKAAQAVLAKKEEVAQTMFASTEHDQEEDQEEYVEGDAEDASTYENEEQDESEDENGDQT